MLVCLVVELCFYGCSHPIFILDKYIFAMAGILKPAFEPYQLFTCIGLGFIKSLIELLDLVGFAIPYIEIP